MAHIRLNQVIVDFPIVNASAQSLQLRLFQALGGKLTSYHQTVVVRALDGLDLDLADGDRLGLIGHNGSGKTTLLRVLAGVYPPAAGSASIEGSVSSFTDLTLGMDLESTGWENIVFRCAFMGLSFQEARRLSPAIAEFSELGEYLSLPTRTYSSGMFLRLAFAISTAIEPDILIMDKMIAAGDLQFIEKAKRRLNRLIDRAQYSCPGLSRYGPDPEYCNKVAWLERGIIKQLGPPDVVTAAYSAASMRPDVGHG